MSSDELRSPKVPLDRMFNRRQKEECWSRADIIEGRDPNRWRYDAVGNPVLKVLYFYI